MMANHSPSAQARKPPNFGHSKLREVVTMSGRSSFGTSALVAKKKCDLDTVGKSPPSPPARTEDCLLRAAQMNWANRDRFVYGTRQLANNWQFGTLIGGS